MRRALFALVLLASTAARAESDAGDVAVEPGADAPTVGASLDRTEALVGDHLTLTVSAVARPAVAQSIRLVEPLALGRFELFESSHQDRDLGDGKATRRFVLRIAAFEPGELEVPAIALTFTTADGRTARVATAPIQVRVRSLLGDDADPKLLPLRPPRAVIVEDQRMMEWLRRGAVAAGVLVVGLIALLVVRRTLKRRRGLPPAVALPVVQPEVLALERLAALRARGGFEVDRFRPFYFAVSEILRGYLGMRFGFESLELTTTELLAELDRVGLAASDPALHGRVIHFLDESDLVKFASASTDEGRALALLDEAEALVRALAASVAAAPVPASHPEPGRAHG